MFEFVSKLILSLGRERPRSNCWSSCGKSCIAWLEQTSYVFGESHFSLEMVVEAFDMAIRIGSVASGSLECVRNDCLCPHCRCRAARHACCNLRGGGKGARNGCSSCCSVAVVLGMASHPCVVAAKAFEIAARNHAPRTLSTLVSLSPYMNMRGFKSR